MDPRNIKIVSEYREPKDNEFFFRENPFNHSAIHSVIDYLKDEYGIVIEEIPGWQLKSEVQTSYSSNGYENVGYGIRIYKEWV